MATPVETLFDSLAQISRSEPQTAAHLIRLLNLAVKVFGEEAKAIAWFEQPNPGLDGERPVDAAQSAEGRIRVERILEAVLHGVYL